MTAGRNPAWVAAPRPFATHAFACDVLRCRLTSGRRRVRRRNPELCALVAGLVARWILRCHPPS